jgi:hypothetical protein
MSGGPGSELPRGEAHPALAGDTGRREAVTVVRRGRAGWQAAPAAPRRASEERQRHARAAERREWVQGCKAIREITIFFQTFFQSLWKFPKVWKSWKKYGKTFPNFICFICYFNNII